MKYLVILFKLMSHPRGKLHLEITQIQFFLPSLDKTKSVPAICVIWIYLFEPSKTLQLIIVYEWMDSLFYERKRAAQSSAFIFKNASLEVQTIDQIKEKLNDPIWLRYYFSEAYF